jgi:hypothetical protein
MNRTVIAVLSFRMASIEAGTSVSDLPFFMASSGHFGTLSRLSHLPG